jgi:hypothetical protein
VALVFTTTATSGQVLVAVPAGMLAMVVREPYLIAQQPLGAQVLVEEAVVVAQVMALLAEMAAVALEFWAKGQTALRLEILGVGVDLVGRMVVVLGLPVILQMEPPEAHTAVVVVDQTQLLAMVERTTAVWVVLAQ